MDIKNKKRIFIFTMITTFICTASHFTFAACNTANAKNGEIEVFVNKKKIKDVPDETVGNITFKDGTNKTIEDAVAIKFFNSASTHYCYWSSTLKAWKFNRLNAKGFNYVKRVCSHAK